MLQNAQEIKRKGEVKLVAVYAGVDTVLYAGLQLKECGRRRHKAIYRDIRFCMDVSNSELTV